MSKNITKTVIQPYAPTDKGVLWFDGRDLRIFHNGVWITASKPMSDEASTRLIELLDINKQSAIEFSSDEAHNLELVAGLDLNYNYICNYKVSDNEILHGTYYNGTIVTTYNNKITTWNVDFNTGVITIENSINAELLAGIVTLDVCSAGSTEADRNLEMLNLGYFNLGDHFLINIDAGIGVGRFIPNSGGEGHITTADGVNVHYIFGADGSVTKDKEVDVNTILESLDNRIKALE